MDIEDFISNKKDLFYAVDLNNLKNFICELIKLNPNDYKEFDDACVLARRKCSISPRKAQIIHYYRQLVENNEIKENQQIEKLMIKKLVRGSSGVQVITVLTSPYPTWVEDGKVKTQEFSCGENCSYCPNEKQKDLSCKVIKIVESESVTTISLQSNDPIDEVRVITFITLDNNKKINCCKQGKFDNEKRIFDIGILRKYSKDIKVNDHCIATKLKQPRSYISDEPGVLRANRDQFDPIAQFFDRGSSLELCGHMLDKVELLVLGGTWSHYPVKYQEDFIKKLYYSANTYYNKNKRKELDLEGEVMLNQTAKCRIIGLTLETRPDCINKHEIIRFRRYGCTRLQLGVQHIDDNILKEINRGCYTRHTIKALYLLKQNGFKIDIHLMPDLPSSSYQIDEEMFNKILGIEKISYKNDITEYKLTSPKLQADQWKIYPTEVTRWTKIYDMFNEGTYKPYAEEINPDTGNKKIIDLLINIKQQVFPWIRLNRVIRDIPSHQIYGGNKVISLRQNLQNKMKAEGKVCRCIRCREIKGKKINLNDVKLKIRKYNDNNADEYFISFESLDESIIYGFCRLRLNHNNEKIFFEELENAALIRELHVYGIMIPHDVKSKKTQHQGFGTRLVRKAEEIAYQNGFRKVVIISGVGVRQYYEKKHNYKLANTYMVKKFFNSDYLLFKKYYFHISIIIVVISIILFYI